MTLAYEDGQQMEAHKIILAASSPFFRKVLERSEHPHPLIYMRGLKSNDLVAIVDFLYFGEADVCQENLDSFLAIAEELQLKGLMGKVDEKVENVSGEEKSESQMTKPNTKPSMSIGAKIQRTIHRGQMDNTIALANDFSGNLEELEERVRSMMEKSQNSYGNRNQKADICKVCGKEGMSNAIKDHIEANHLEGIVLPCNHCEKTFRCRNSLKKHMQKDH